ncbi:hypothetical protein BJX65DRAFT_307409 [Aspergillus insuetus]
MAKEHSLPYINFLHSPIVSLQATEAGQPFHIHRDLLANTSEGTLARFIEWAYTGDDPATIVPAQSTGEPAKKEESNETDKVLTATGRNQRLPPCRATIHSRHTCGSFERVTACFTELDKPEDLDTQLAVIAALRLAFRKLLTDDPLLDWLGQYVA